MYIAYCLDFRKRVFKLKKEEGLTYQDTSDRFKAPIRTLFKRSNSLDAKTTRDHPYNVALEALKKDVEENPDLYQRERAKKFGVSQPTICKLLRVLGISYKKRYLIQKRTSKKGLTFN